MSSPQLGANPLCIRSRRFESAGAPFPFGFRRRGAVDAVLCESPLEAMKDVNLQ
jgi:hypothetical protein